MPFTPFHMGPALLLKSAAPRRFSLLVFGVSQVLIDLEPLVRIIRGDRELHGFTHTITGALLIALAAAAVGRPFANLTLALLRRQDGEAWAAPLISADVSWRTAFTSAVIGTGSHLLLDGIMHADMSPFAPILATNPLLGAVGLGTLHLFCVATGLVGVVAVIVRGARSARRDGVSGRRAP